MAKGLNFKTIKTMKTVYSSHSEVCHIWANNTDENAIGHASNIFFEGDTIYSYGRHFILGKWFIHNGRVITFLNTKSYSNSTSKHQNHLRQAVNGSTFSINFPNNSCFELGHLGQVRRDLEEEIKDLIKKQLRARSNDYYIREVNSKCALIDNLNECFPEIVNPINMFEIEGYREASLYARDLTNSREQREEAKQARKVEQEQKYLNQWLNGSWNGQLYNLPIYLRFNDNYIETSHGAKVPTLQAFKLLRDIREGKDCKGVKIGNYTLIETTLDHVKIGCHVIGWNVINEFFNDKV
jgi:hypothetical protein